MILFFFLLAFGNPIQSINLDQLDHTATTLKQHLQELQDYSSARESKNIPVASILSVSEDVKIEIKKIQKQVNQMDNPLK